MVTRPAHLATELIDAIQQQGGEVICYPTVIIEPIDSPAQRQHHQQLISQSDLVILISKNAIEYAHKLIDHTLLTERTLAVVGQKSADHFFSLFQHPVDIIPTISFDSEGLLATTELQSGSIKSKNIVIIRGEGGREHLANRLRERGAIVDYLELYRRKIPEGSDRSPDPDWQSGNIDVVITSSNAILENLYAMTSDENRDALLKTPQIVASQRGQKVAAQLGFHYDAFVAENATTEAMLSALVKWHQQKN